MTVDRERQIKVRTGELTVDGREKVEIVPEPIFKPITLTVRDWPLYGPSPLLAAWDAMWLQMALRSSWIGHDN